MLRKTNTFYCFSPPVMLATLLIEISFAFYILWRYKMSNVTRLTVSILFCLAIFQGTEYLICGGSKVDSGIWSRLGYSAITLLPPLGLHLSYAIANKKSKLLVPTAYVTAGAFLAYFVFGVSAITGTTCYANYAVFHGGNATASWLYGLYYYGWLFIGVGAAYLFGRNSKTRLKTALFGLAIGYLAFLLPTTTVNLINPETIAGIPSIMCGFAVILAFILTFKVAPHSLYATQQPALRKKFF